MKTVVITGVSRGIGEALANKFLQEGYGVIGTSTSGKSKINSPNLMMIKLDLSDTVSIKKAGKDIKNTTANIDILMNNAGISADEELGKIDINVLRKNLEVNLIGLIAFTELLLPIISQNGHIINMSSIMGSLTIKLGNSELDFPAYRISKTAINMYTKTLASRVKGRGIIVSSVHPGWVKTDMGGKDATKEPTEAANEIYKLAITPHETGLFWHDNKICSW